MILRFREDMQCITNSDICGENSAEDRGLETRKIGKTYLLIGKHLFLFYKFKQIYETEDFVQQSIEFTKIKEKEHRI